MNPVAAIARKPRLLVKDGSVKTTSLAVADIFGKQHYNVLRDIARIVSPDSGLSERFSRLNFEARDYVDERGKVQPMYDMTKDGFVLLVMGYTGQKAMAFKEAYIEAFNAMERTLAERGLVAGLLPEMDRAGMGLARLLPVCGGHRVPAQILEYLIRRGAGEALVSASIRTIMADIVGGSATTGGVFRGLKYLRMMGLIVDDRSEYVRRYMVVMSELNERLGATLPVHLLEEVTVH